VKNLNLTRRRDDATNGQEFFLRSISRGSGAAGLKSGQFDRKRNFEKANNEYRIMNVEVMYSVYFKKRQSAATPSFRIPHSDFRIRQM
jgi:hypothetical protein